MFRPVRWVPGLYHANAPLAQEAAKRHHVCMVERLLDAKYLKGPMPVLRAARVLRSLAAGAKLRVLATDPGTVVDFRDFCRDTGHALISWSEVKGVFSFTIRAAGTETAEGVPD